MNVNYRFSFKMTFAIYLFVSLEACHVDDERPTDPISQRYLLGKCTEDIGSSEHHSILPNSCQYNESSDAELERLENPHYDETPEGTFNLNPGQANER